MARRKSSYTYGSVPMVYHSRSKFDLSYSHKTTGNVGQLLPLYCQEVYPGDSFKCDASIVARLTSSFLKPVMDNLFCDVMFFFVPSRTVFDQWAEIFGENNQSAYARQTTVSAPVISGGAGSTVQVAQPGTLASYLGIPFTTMGVIGTLGGINVLPFRAYAKVYNEWYRDENLVDPVNLQTGDAAQTEVFNQQPFGPDNYTGLPAKVSRLHDYFSQVLVSPQKGDPVSIGVGVVPGTLAPVVTAPGTVPSSAYPLRWRTLGSNDTGAYGDFVVSGSSGGGTAAGYTYTSGTVPSLPSTAQQAQPLNLWAQIPQNALQAVDVNDLRYAFQLQKLLERDSVYGTRFTEYLHSHFSVTSPDARLQRSEFLGGRRFPITVLQATQTSQATSDSPLGNVAGWSLSNGRAGYTKGFTEHGFVLGMFCIRQFHTYQQGCEKFWWRKNRLDYLDPLLTTIGFQPVFTKELYLSSSDATATDDVFGYAPAFEDLRCRQNRVSGQLLTSASEGLDIWHFADNYGSKPVLSQSFIEEVPDYVDRALSVPSTTVDQFIFDVYFKQYAIRVMPTYGMPGLIDHH